MKNLYKKISLFFTIILLFSCVVFSQNTPDSKIDSDSAVVKSTLLSSANDILSFTLPQQTGSAIINTTTHYISIQIGMGNYILALSPTITVSPFATVSPASGTVHNFSTPVNYLVTAQDGSTQNWTAVITQPTMCDYYGAPGISIGSLFAAIGSTVTVPVKTLNCFIDIGAVTLKLDYNPTQLTFVSTSNVNAALSANMTIANNAVNATSAYIMVVWSDINGATVYDGSLLFNANFTFNTGPALISFDNTGAAGSNCEFAEVLGYVLTDTPTSTYYINGTISPPSTSNNIVSFSFPQQTGAAAINSTNHTVNIEVTNGTSLLSLKPTITVSPYANISPASGTIQNFTNPINYTVTSQSGTPQVWVVAVTVAPSGAKDILSFTLPQQTGAATINTINHTVNIQIASGVLSASLLPSITVSALATISPAGGVLQNFTNPVIYTVTAENGTSREWLVSVTNEHIVEDTKLRAIDCGITISDLFQPIYCDRVTGASDYEWEFTSGSFSYSRTKGSSNSSFRLRDINGIEYEKTYNVRVRALKNSVWGNFSTVCQITTGGFPTTKLRSDYCGVTIPSMNQYLYCDIISGALDYEWEFTNSSSNYSFTKARGTTSPTMLLSWITGLNYSTSYNVRIRTKVGSQWGNFGAVCQITTPDIPATKIRSLDCGIILPSFQKYFYCDRVNLASDYEWEFVESMSGATVTKKRGSGSSSMNLSLATGVQYGKTYNVRVRAKLGTQWGSFGAICQITAPVGSVQRTMNNEQQILINKSVKSSVVEVFPNPVGNGNSFIVAMQSDDKLNNCKINIYNIIGQIIYSKQISVDENNYSLTIEQNNTFHSGLFFIHVDVNGELKRLKLVVE